MAPVLYRRCLPCLIHSMRVASLAIPLAAWGYPPDEQGRGICMSWFCRGYHGLQGSSTVRAAPCECMTDNDCYYSWDARSGVKTLTPVCSGASSATNTVGRCVAGPPMPFINFHQHAARTIPRRKLLDVSTVQCTYGARFSALSTLSTPCTLS